MKVGINYPWIDYGWDFGDPPPRWVAPGDRAAWREAKRQRIDEGLRRLAATGFFAVRWFILADGTSYGVDGEVPRFDGDQWRFDPLPADHSFHRQLVDDFEFLLQTCAAHGLQLIPSLIDFHWCFPGEEIPGNPGIIKGGRGEILTDRAKREAFFDAVLEPLLAVSVAHHQTICAWELINEPEWAVRPPALLFWQQDEKRTIAKEEMLDFIATGLARINRCSLDDGLPAFHSTIGFAHFETLEDWGSAALGATFHQYHYYAQNGQPVAPHESTGCAPCFVGELATAVERPWPDLESQSITSRLASLEAKDYPAAFLWSANATDPATAWTAAEEAETIAWLSKRVERYQN